MEDFLTLFKSAPWEAVGMALAAGVSYRRLAINSLEVADSRCLDP